MKIEVEKQGARRSAVGIQLFAVGSRLASFVRRLMPALR